MEMRVLTILLTVISFVSLALGQNEVRSEVPIRDYFPSAYKNSNNLKVFLNKATKELKSFPNSKIIIIYYKGVSENIIKFNNFKTKVLKTLVKSNKIEADRILIVDSKMSYYDLVSFIVWIVDENGNPIYPI